MSWELLIRVFQRSKQGNEVKPRRKIKAGVHSDGRPYLDMSDRDTAKAFQEQAEAFEGIKVG